MCRSTRRIVSRRSGRRARLASGEQHLWENKYVICIFSDQNKKEEVGTEVLDIINPGETQAANVEEKKGDKEKEEDEHTPEEDTVMSSV